MAKIRSAAEFFLHTNRTGISNGQFSSHSDKASAVPIPQNRSGAAEAYVGGASQKLSAAWNSASQALSDPSIKTKEDVLKLVEVRAKGGDTFEMARPVQSGESREQSQARAMYAQAVKNLYNLSDDPNELAANLKDLNFEVWNQVESGNSPTAVLEFAAKVDKRMISEAEAALKKEGVDPSKLYRP